MLLRGGAGLPPSRQCAQAAASTAVLWVMNSRHCSVVAERQAPQCVLAGGGVLMDGACSGKQLIVSRGQAF